MSMKITALIVAISLALPGFSLAQGTIPGAERGAREGDAAAGPVGGVVGGAAGAATGTVGGVLGEPADRGCESKTIHKEDGAGNSETIHRTNCP
jgi:hypothetical protein